MSSPDPLPMDASTPRAGSRRARQVAYRDACTRAASVFCFYAGVITPIVCFICSARAGNWLQDALWQSGEFSVYASLMLTARIGWPFYPLLLYSMHAITFFAIRRDAALKRFSVRLGLYGGCALAWMYVLLVYTPHVFDLTRLIEAMAQLAAATSLGVLAAVIVAFGFHASGLVVRTAARRHGWHKVIYALIAIVVIAVIALFVPGLRRMILESALVGLIAILISGPIFTALTFSYATAHAACYGEQRWRVSHLLLGTGWAACQLAAWRKSMDLAIAAYAQLPTEDPRCYVCTAAARGHRRFVSSRSVVVAQDGRVASVNDQLQTLKAAELALAIATPRFHRKLRRLYNRIGPPIAR